MPATDNFASNATGLDSPARKAFAITAHDTNELSNVTRALFVGVGGDVVVVCAGDSTAVTFKNVVDGGVIPVQAKIVKSTGTTATDIVGLY